MVEPVETTVHSSPNEASHTSTHPATLSHMPFTYMLRCSDGTYYVGSTRFDLSVRVNQHNSGTGSRYTACRRPVEVVWAAEFAKVTEAFSLEEQIQNWSRAKREALIEGRFATSLACLGRRPGSTSRRTRGKSDPS